MEWQTAAVVRSWPATYFLRPVTVPWGCSTCKSWHWRLVPDVLLLVFILGPLTVRAEYLALNPVPTAEQLRATDEIWLVSTRHVTAAPEEPFLPDVKRFVFHDRSCTLGACLRASSLEDLVAAAPMWTLVYVHGNRMTYEESLQSGWDLYCALVGSGDLPPLRLVIWSWPSDPVHGLLRDVRCKAARADAEAHLLAVFLQQLSPQTDVALIGYSFGTRVIAGGVHLLAGGRLQGRGVPEPNAALGPRHLRAVLLAAAMPADVLSAGNPYSDAVERLDRALVLFNSCDPVLKHYGWVEACHRRQAMGYVGIQGMPVRENVVWEYDVAPLVGRTHHLWYYFASSSVVRMIRQYTLPPSGQL